jgi:hypothetical protein
MPPEEQEPDPVTARPPSSGQVRILIEGAPSELLALNALASLLLGSATEGGDQLARRLDKWQAEIRSNSGALYSESPNETEAERLRFALIGLLTIAPGKASAMFSTAVDLSDSVYGVVSALLSPLLSSAMMRPVRRRYGDLAARGEVMVEHWIDTGRRAEQQSRALARQAAFDGEDEVFDQVIGVMAQKPAVRELITQQSMGLADTFVNEIRSRTARADAEWERRVSGIFRRR